MALTRGVTGSDRTDLGAIHRGFRLRAEAIQLLSELSNLRLDSPLLVVTPSLCESSRGGGLAPQVEKHPAAAFVGQSRVMYERLLLGRASALLVDSICMDDIPIDASELGSEKQLHVNEVGGMARPSTQLGPRVADHAPVQPPQTQRRAGGKAPAAMPR